MYLFTICHTVYILFFWMINFCRLLKTCANIRNGTLSCFFPFVNIYFLHWETGQLGTAEVSSSDWSGVFFQYSPTITGDGDGKQGSNQFPPKSGQLQVPIGQLQVSIGQLQVPTVWWQHDIAPVVRCTSAYTKHQGTSSTVL